jgi:hypothetical protein
LQCCCQNLICVVIVCIRENFKINFFNEPALVLSKILQHADTLRAADAVGLLGRVEAGPGVDFMKPFRQNLRTKIKMLKF